MPPEAPPPTETTTSRKGDSKPAPQRPPHQRGPIPRTPRANLPEGAPRPGSDSGARHEIAGGSTTDELRAGVDDAELRKLRQAERVLFPRPLPGARPGWSWELPQPVDSDAAEIVASGPPPSVRLEPRVTTGLKPDAEWLRSLTLPTLPVRLEAHVVKYLQFYRDDPQGRAIARVWAQKSGRYTAALKAELAKSGLPTDLVWLSLIESGHNPTIVSPAGAAGLWQFMPEAARIYGLTVDRWVDERLDPQRSTEAAVRYLSDLYRRFGSWELAMAAYNMGYAGLMRAMRKFNTNDFWELSRYEAGVPWETALYVPKILATAVVMNNKKAFGIDSVIADPPLRFDTVLVDPGVPIDQVAAAAALRGSELQSLNPQYRAGRTPPSRPGERASSWAVRLPAGSAARVARRVAAEATPDPELESFVVRLGDTLDSIAAARRSSVEQIKKLNRIEKDEVLSAGNVLLVPKRGGAVGAKSADDEVMVVPPRAFRYPDRERVFYRALTGDTLSRVAQALGVTTAELLAWNALDENARLQPGMVVQAYVASAATLGGVKLVRERNTRVLVSGSVEFFDYFEGLNGRKRISVVAREGDTLRSIGKRYGMSVGWMERINRRSRSKKLEPGDNLIVYTQRGAVGDAKSQAVVPPPKPASGEAPLPDESAETRPVEADDRVAPGG